MTKFYCLPWDHVKQFVRLRGRFSSVLPTKGFNFLRPLSLGPNVTSTFSLVMCGPAMKIWWGLLWLPETSSPGIHQAHFFLVDPRQQCLPSSPLSSLESPVSFSLHSCLLYWILAPYLIRSKPRSPPDATRKPYAEHSYHLMTLFCTASLLFL